MIDIETYRLNKNNYHQDEYEKRQIVLGNTFTSDMLHYVGWKTRVGGDYKKTATFTINLKGEVFQHFDPDFYSDFLPKTLFNKHIISIMLENKGWFDYDVLEKKHIDWCGNIYDNNDVIEKRWRSHSFWQKYTDEQLKSAVDLITRLLGEYNIPNQVMGHNTYVREISSFQGVCYRSNWVKDSTDLNPSWKFDEFKDMIENNKVEII
jgi:N-acetyl-anhydromuramyl-L-alanine amidase AmpD